jgi:diaminohydroxyphosphoribosylaminopyrimidine deaminase/5-amino-6-(5-phosphoribosylamino)uracil reductase
MNPDTGPMVRALALARGRLGRTAPNPAVGCVLVRDGVIIAEAATGEGGRPHAEELALEAAGVQARGAVAYVTLEPCAKRSAGAPSCAARLVAAGVAKVIVAVGDPHANAAGAGLAALRAAGVPVELGLCEAEAAHINAGFFRVVREGLPLLAAADGATGFDAAFAAAPGEDLRAALARAAASGLTRLWVARDDPRLPALRAQGLLSPDA